MTRYAHKRQSSRRGAIAVLSAILMIGMMALLAFAIDMGVVMVARDEMQRTADAAAIAAAWELIDEQVALGTLDPAVPEDRAREKAALYAGLNPVLQEGPSLAQQDVEVGYLGDISDPALPLDFSGDEISNSVRVVIRRTQTQNGDIPLFFARAFGRDSATAQTEATAAVLTNIGGFQAPADGSSLDLLPFALDLETWTGLMAGGGTDNWNYDATTGGVTAGSDGIKEVNLYPQGTGSPGNRGTVDIGGSNNSTADIARQILFGISAKDLSHVGGTLEFNELGYLYLNGDTGISAGVKDELESITGKPRIIPLFSHVEAPGNNATFTIVKFVGVRILEVKLTGSMSSKRVIIQPAAVMTKGAIPSPRPDTSEFVFSPARLVR